MTAHDTLYGKMVAEYEAFITQLATKPPEEIIDHAFEKVFKEDILLCLEYDGAFGDEQIAVLLAMDAPLEEVYQHWVICGESYMDGLRNSMESFMDKQIEYNREANAVSKPVAQKALQRGSKRTKK